MISESFNEDFASACVDAGIGGLDCTRISNGISEFVNLDGLRAYYISTQPLPGFPKTKLDIFLLTKKFMYNYEITEDEEVWSIVPLANISHMRESRWSTDEYWALNILINPPSDQNGALVIIDSIGNRHQLREFAGALRDGMSETS